VRLRGPHPVLDRRRDVLNGRGGGAAGYRGARPCAFMSVLKVWSVGFLWRNKKRVEGRGLHSFTSQLNLSALYGIGGGA